MSSTDRVHQERAARNQGLFREVNERIEGLLNRPTGILEEFICECLLDGCTGTMKLTIEEYEAVRAHPARFAVLPGHFDSGVELVVESADSRYLVVEKIERAGEVAASMDPRGTEHS